MCSWRENLVATRRKCGVCSIPGTPPNCPGSRKVLVASVNGSAPIVPTSSARYATELTRVICARASASRLRTSNCRDPGPDTKASNAAMWRLPQAMARSCFARKRSLYQSLASTDPRVNISRTPRVLLLGEARRQDFLLLVLNILNSLADFFHVLRALVEGENPAGGAEALVVTNLQKRLQQVE